MFALFGELFEFCSYKIISLHTVFFSLITLFLSAITWFSWVNHNCRTQVTIFTLVSFAYCWIVSSSTNTKFKIWWPEASSDDCFAALLVRNLIFFSNLQIPRMWLILAKISLELLDTNGHIQNNNGRFEIKCLIILLNSAMYDACSKAWFSWLRPNFILSVHLDAHVKARMNSDVP